MDISDYMTIWKYILKHKIVSWNNQDGYFILFVKDDEVVGNIKTVAGGIRWDLPDDLMKEIPDYKKLTHEQIMQLYNS
jgi:hypothetical protein